MRQARLVKKAEADLHQGELLNHAFHFHVPKLRTVPDCGLCVLVEYDACHFLIKADEGTCRQECLEPLDSGIKVVGSYLCKWGATCQLAANASPKDRACSPP